MGNQNGDGKWGWRDLRVEVRREVMAREEEERGLINGAAQLRGRVSHRTAAQPHRLLMMPT